MSNLATIVNNILADSGIDDISVVIGSGTSGYIPVFTSTGRTIGNSILNQSGGNLLIGGNIALHAGNFNSYAPTLTGVGASGTWSISITGNADTVDGYHMNQNLLTTSTPTFAGLTTNGNITVNGIGIFNSTNDHQISLRSSDVWTGIEFDDSQSGVDYIWFNGTYQTFAIGGGGASVSGKKLHIDGGTTIGANYDSTSVPSNGLAVEGTIKGAAYFDSQANSGFRLRNSSDSANVGGFTRRGLWEGNSNYDPAIWAETGYGIYLYTNGSASPRITVDTNGNTTIHGALGVGQSPNTSYRIITAGDIYLNGNANGWAEGTWKQRRGGGTYYDVIDTGNFNSYAPTLTGGGASGTWPISIAGNASNTSSISNAVGSSYTWTGEQYFRSNRNTTSSNPPLQAYSNDSGGAIMSFHRAGVYAVNFGLDSDNVMRIGGWSAPNSLWQLDMSGNNYIAASSRAPIFYDLDNTAYYINGANTSDLNALKLNGLFLDREEGAARGISWYSASFTAWSQYMSPAGAGGSGPTGNITAPSGTLVTSWGLRSFIENVSGYGWTFESGTTTGQPSIVAEIRSSDGSAQFNGSVRSPIFFDSNNTNYYLDPASTSSLRTVGSWRSDSAAWDGEFNGKIQYHANSWYFQAAGDWLFRNSGGTNVFSVAQSGRVFYSNYLVSTNSGGLMGDYNVAGTTTKVIWTIGESWPLASMYGLAYEYGSGYGHHLALKNNGTTYSRIGFAGDSFLGGSNSAGGDFRAPIFYDSNDTGYYVDPNSTSNDALRIRGGALFGPNPTWGEYLAVGTNGRWSGSYASVATTNGNLHLDAKDGSNIYLAWYNGSDVIVGGGIQSTIYYDRNDTGFYVNPNSASRLNIIYPNTSYFGVDGNKGYGQGFGTYSSSLHKIAYMSFDWDSNYDTYSNHGIASTSRFGGFSDSMSINSYNDINLRIDTNDNDSSSYVRFHHHTTGENTFAYIGYNHCISEFQMFLAGMYCTSSYSGYCYNDGYYNGGYSSSAYMRSSDFCQIFNTGFCGLYVVNYGPSMDFGTYSLIQRPSTGECFCYDGGSGTLYIGGNICQNYYSDCKYKENITEIDSALDKIEAMRGVEFDWNELGEEEAFRKGHEVGVIAQEVQAVYPQAVREVYKEREDYVATALVVDYEKFTPLLIQSIKELKVKVDNIKSRLDAGGL
jgi:hypothetical protein